MFIVFAVRIKKKFHASHIFKNIVFDMIVELWSAMQSALWNLDEKWCESTEDSHFLRKFHHSWPEAMVYSLKCLKCWYFFHTLILHQKTMTHQLGLYRLLSSLFCMVFKAFWETHIAVYKSKLSKKLHLCSADKRKSYTSGMARGGPCLNMTCFGLLYRKE